MRIAVTGASGFVGGAVCRALASEGTAVLAFGRRPAVAPGRVGGAPYRSWDLTRGPLPDAPAVDAVVHCAGSVTDWGPSAALFAANLTGTRNALGSFPGARFVHVSTASVYDPFTPSVMAREDEAPVRRYMNAYGASRPPPRGPPRAPVRSSCARTRSTGPATRRSFRASCPPCGARCCPPSGPAASASA
ncbi:NAD-dependent epimerase/dehydratase family protein [Actinomadura luteofluorescens]|uniref:NAD-dependent epimerase/dehydratase family protein n=1 Tax=Actinomadura luteofluorescens TaxID=46163 RepID=UPI003632FDFD